MYAEGSLGQVTSKPQKLNPSMLANVSHFDCGDVVLNDWLQNEALDHQSSCLSTVYVAVTDRGYIAAYMALSCFTIHKDAYECEVDTTIPSHGFMLLGKLAVDNNFKGKKLGTSMLREAFYYFIAVSEMVGCAGLAVHVISDEAKMFYQKFGFVESKKKHKKGVETLYLSAKSIYQLKSCLPPH